MYSPVTSTLRGENIFAATSQQHTTCHIDTDVAAQATKSLLDAFNEDPINAVNQEIMVAIGTPVINVNADNPYHVTCSTDVAYIRIDAANLTEDCKEVTCCCEIRPISGEFRIHLIGETHALVDTRNTNHLLQPWALCSRNADLTLRYYDARSNTAFVYKPANYIYAPLPELVETYINNTLQRTYVPNIDDQLMQIATAQHRPMRHGVTAHYHQTSTATQHSSQAAALPAYIGRNGGICTDTVTLYHGDEHTPSDPAADRIITTSPVVMRNLAACDLRDTLDMVSNQTKTTVELRTVTAAASS